MNEELESLLQMVSRRGITCAEVYQVAAQSYPVYFEGNRLKQLESSQSLGTALRLWHHNRPGVAVAYGKIEPTLLIDQAISLAQLNQPEIIDLAPPRQAIHNLVGAPKSVTELVNLGHQAIEQLREEYPELICAAELEFEQETTTLINSQGLQCQCRESGLSYYLSAELVRGEDFLGVYDGEYTRNDIALDEVLEGIIRRLDWAKRNVSPPQGRIPVLLTANAATLLWHTATAALNGQRVQEQSSPWNKMLGELAVSEQVSLTQQPEQQPYDCPFDDEGMPTQTLELINRGVLRQFYCDRAVARELQIPPTGNGFRPSLDSYPVPGLVNLVVAPGVLSFRELIRELDHGIIVDQILGSGPDISGDFSVNVDLGYRVDQGRIVGRIKDTAIAGNVYEILKQVVAMGKSRIWNGSCYTPALIVEGISVVG